MDTYIDILNDIYIKNKQGELGKSGLVVIEKGSVDHVIIECVNIPMEYTDVFKYDCIIPWKINENVPTVLDMVHASYNTVAFYGLIPFKAIISEHGLFFIKSLNHNGPLKDFEYYSKNSGRSRVSSRYILGRGITPVIFNESLCLPDVEYGTLEDYWCTSLISKCDSVPRYMMRYIENSLEMIDIIINIAKSHGVNIEFISRTKDS